MRRLMVLPGLLVLIGCQLLYYGGKSAWDTNRAVFEQGQAFIHQAEAGEELYFYCHVNEAPTCFFVPYDQIGAYDGTYDADLYQNRMPRDLASDLINMLGGMAFESMPNNGTKARCIRMDGDVICERVINSER